MSATSMCSCRHDGSDSGETSSRGCIPSAVALMSKPASPIGPVSASDPTRTLPSLSRSAGEGCGLFHRAVEQQHLLHLVPRQQRVEHGPRRAARTEERDLGRQRVQAAIDLEALHDAKGVGIVPHEPTIAVGNGINRANALGLCGNLVEMHHDGLLVRHRYIQPDHAEGAHSGERFGQGCGSNAERRVHIVEIQRPERGIVHSR